jgi:hypothetical protein
VNPTGGVTTPIAACREGGGPAVVAGIHLREGDAGYRPTSYLEHVLTDR